MKNLKRLFAVLLAIAVISAMFVMPTQAALPSGASVTVFNGYFE